LTVFDDCAPIRACLESIQAVGKSSSLVDVQIGQLYCQDGG
jgi:hypothetical protein